MADVLANPAWSSLTGRQAHLALSKGRAVRYAPEYNVFAAIPDASPESLADLGELVRAHGFVGVLGEGGLPPVPGAVAVSQAGGLQWLAPDAPPPAPDFEVVDLTDDDGPQMLALATLTEPGPFFARTHQLGAFNSVMEDGRLAAMAGERMRPDGFTEISGVCTHPDFRGRGYGAALTLEVAARIRARGDIPFLHTYAANAPAIALYKSLGFTLARELVMTVLAPAGADPASVPGHGA
jgi:predicted GNAT family acetyltransferase